MKDMYVVRKMQPMENLLEEEDEDIPHDQTMKTQPRVCSYRGKLSSTIETCFKKHGFAFHFE